MTGEPDGRAAFRAFVRVNHPDVGGDPERFRQGMVEFGRASADSDGTRFLGRSSCIRDAERYDTPVTFVVNPTGVVALVHRFTRWWRRRRRRRVV